MSDRAIVVLCRIAVATGAAAAVIGTGILLASDHRALWITEYGAFLALPAAFFAVFVWLVVPRQPRNALVWVMALSSHAGGVYVAGLAVAVLIIDDPNLEGLTGLAPAQMPAAAAWVLAGAQPAAVMSTLAWFTFGLLLFPDGRLPSPRWRWVAWPVGVALGLGSLTYATAHLPNRTVPADQDPFFGALLYIILAGMVASVVALGLRFRHSHGATREQFKWIFWGASVMVPVMIVAIQWGGTSYQSHTALIGVAGEAVFLTAYGIAVGRYRLFDVDVVISRTVVYGTLGAFITGVYVVAVVGVGQLLGGGSEPNAALAIAATAVVAVAFQPLRRRLQRTANRLVYGKKATPYEVLSQFSTRVAAADPSLLDRVARSLVEGTGARRADIWVAVGDTRVRTGGWPAGDGALTDDAEMFPIEEGGVELGTLTLAPPAGQRLSGEDERLAGEVASGMGLALRNQQLTRTLQTRVDELEISRRRLVGVQDETRRKLERDLHDGAQQQLVALKVKLALAQTIAERGSGVQTAALLRQLAGEADASVGALRDFARGVYPPLLEAEGVAAAIRTQADRLPVPVAVEADGVGRYEGQLEATIYFCVVEALQNIAKHAAASSATVCLTDHNGTVSFEIADDGGGFDPATAMHGTGLVNIRDRVEAAGGTLTIESTPGRGTRLLGSVPRQVRR